VPYFTIRAAWGLADLFSATDLACNPKRLLRELRPVAAKYQALGVQLGVPLAKIREFETEAGGQDVKRFLREVLGQWPLASMSQMDITRKGFEILHQ